CLTPRRSAVWTLVPYTTLFRSPHSMISSWGGMAPPKDPSMVKPIERILNSGLFGPWDRPDIKGIAPDELPPAINPSRQPFWGQEDRKSTRLNSSHVKNSYAVFC